MLLLLLRTISRLYTIINTTEQQSWILYSLMFTLCSYYTFQLCIALFFSDIATYFSVAS